MEQVKERAQSIKERAKQKMQETNKAITTLGEQITDSYNQYLGDRKGTYSRVPTSSPDDVLKRFDADVTNIDEREQTRKNIKGSDV